MLNIGILFLLWCVLAMIETMRFSGERKFSDFERIRLADKGDADAIQEAHDISLEPLLQSLQIIVKTLLVMSIAAFSTLTYGVIEGIVLSAVLVLLVPLASRLPFVCRWSDRLRDAGRPAAEKLVSGARPILKWLRARDVVVSDSTLNSHSELIELVRRSPGVLSKDERERLEASLKFDGKRVGDVMTPRSMIKAVEANETLGPLVIDELYKTGFSRFPVYSKDLDHIEGVLYLHDLLDLKKGSQTAKKAMQPKVYFIGENKSLTHALHGFLSSKKHLFVVVNNYRETVGLLSLEDVMEQLLGRKIVDEFDAFDDLRAVAEHNSGGNNQSKGKEDI